LKTVRRTVYDVKSVRYHDDIFLSAGKFRALALYRIRPDIFIAFLKIKKKNPQLYCYSLRQLILSETNELNGCEIKEDYQSRASMHDLLCLLYIYKDSVFSS
jgi:hypothetical protein